MGYLANWGDERQVAFCPQCGGPTGTRDHIPPRVLLDEPYPLDLPVVPACLKCNVGASLDEEYVACLIDCAIVGETDPGTRHRPKVARILEGSPALRARLSAAKRSTTEGGAAYHVEVNRIRNVILKIARGHALFELNEPHPAEPAKVGFQPLETMSQHQRAGFEKGPEQRLWPEVGSRAMQRLTANPSSEPEWVIVQEGRYRYAAFASPHPNVRLVLSEYLGAGVVWG